MRTFSALAQEQKIEEFRKLDQKLADLSIDYIKAKLSGDIPGRHDTDRAPGYGVLARQIQRRAGHMPVRQLVGELGERSEEHTSELQSLMRISYAVFCLKKKTQNH